MFGEWVRDWMGENACLSSSSCCVSSTHFNKRTKIPRFSPAICIKERMEFSSSLTAVLVRSTASNWNSPDQNTFVSKPIGVTIFGGEMWFIFTNVSVVVVKNMTVSSLCEFFRKAPKPLVLKMRLGPEFGATDINYVRASERGTFSEPSIPSRPYRPMRDRPNRASLSGLRYDRVLAEFTRSAHLRGVGP